MKKGTNQQELIEWCERIYEKDGQGGVFDFILEYHHEQPWYYCEPCEIKSPISVERTPVCLVCGSVV